MANMKDIENLPEFEGGSGNDLSELEGTRAKIELIEIKDVKSPWSEGKKLPDGQFKDTKVIKVSTSVLSTIKNKEGKEMEVRASELFNLTEKDGKWGISKSPKSGVQRFLTKQKVSKVKDLIGTTVIVTSNTDSNGKTFLGFVNK
jgi:hypothetical protein